jgi:hypothetical protein
MSQRISEYWNLFAAISLLTSPFLSCTTSRSQAERSAPPNKLRVAFEVSSTSDGPYKVVNHSMIDIDNTCRDITPNPAPAKCVASLQLSKDGVSFDSYLEKCAFNWQTFIYDNNPTLMLFEILKIFSCRYRSVAGKLPLPEEAPSDGVCIASNVRFYSCRAK